MSNNNPVQTEEFKETWYKSYGGDDLNIPLGSKIFSIRMPVDVEAIFLKMNNRDRVAFMRSVLVKAARENCQLDECPDVLSQ